MTTAQSSSSESVSAEALRRVLQENIRILRSSDLFDIAYYEASYPDVARLGVDPIEHYVCYGSAEGRNPAPWFDSALYLEFYPHIAQKNINPFVHYVHSGKAAGYMAFAVGGKGFLLQQARSLTAKALEGSPEESTQEQDFFAALHVWTQLSMRFPTAIVRYKTEIEQCCKQALQVRFVYDASKPVTPHSEKSAVFTTQRTASFTSPLAVVLAQLTKLTAQPTPTKGGQSSAMLWQSLGRFLPKSEAAPLNVKPLAFFLSHAFLLGFYANLIRILPPESMDIIFTEGLFSTPQMQEEHMRKHGFTAHTAFTGLQKIQEYGAVVLDPYSFEMLPELAPFLAQHAHIKVIVLSHSMDAKVTVRARQHCLLVGCERQTRKLLGAQEEFYVRKEVLRSAPNVSNVLSSIAPQAKMEVGYTGPHHMDDYLPPTSDMKQALRKDIEQALGYQFETGKKVVAVFVDEISHKKQFICGINALAEHAHVILKVLSTEESYLRKLSPKVFVWKDIGLAPNTLRFGADVIMAGYRSGTFFSSCMLGLLVLPFYSRYEDARWGYGATQKLTRPYAHHMESWLRFLEPQKSLSAPALLTQYFLHKEKVFDILHTSKLVEALYDSAYGAWYANHISTVQQHIFGEYTLAGVGKQTAQYIMQFATEGTLGEHCAGVYFRPECVVK